MEELIFFCLISLVLEFQVLQLYSKISQILLFEPIIRLIFGRNLVTLKTSFFFPKSIVFCGVKLRSFFKTQHALSLSVELHPLCGFFYLRE